MLCSKQSVAGSLGISRCLLNETKSHNNIFNSSEGQLFFLCNFFLVEILFACDLHFQ